MDEKPLPPIHAVAMTAIRSPGVHRSVSVDWTGSVRGRSFRIPMPLVPIEQYGMSLYPRCSFDGKIMSTDFGHWYFFDNEHNINTGLIIQTDDPHSPYWRDLARAYVRDVRGRDEATRLDWVERVSRMLNDRVELENHAPA